VEYEVKFAEGVTKYESFGCYRGWFRQAQPPLSVPEGRALRPRVEYEVKFAEGVTQKERIKKTQ
jgi:hypothetical protein